MATDRVVGWKFSLIGIVLLGLSFLLSGIADAKAGVAIGIVDSGIDADHNLIKFRYARRDADKSYNRIDDDRNGYVDDTFGWDLVRNTGFLFVPQLRNYYNKDFKKFTQVQMAVSRRSASYSDRLWYQQKVSNPTFMNQLRSFSSIAHGTHVAGIATRVCKTSKVVNVKILKNNLASKVETSEVATVLNPITTKLLVDGLVSLRAKYGPRLNSWINRVFKSSPSSSKHWRELKRRLTRSARTTSTKLERAAKYLRTRNVRVVNGSFGVPTKNAGLFVQKLFYEEYNRYPQKGELETATRFYMNELVRLGKIKLAQFPEMLFVFAAGNEGLRTSDIVRAYPASIDLPNVISVAASYSSQALASFSNHGDVDLAASGVLVRSAVPTWTKQETYLMSGTSQAAPLVSSVAARMLEINPGLKPSIVKRFLNETVDQNLTFKGKVHSAGSLNIKRAVAAAEASLRYTVSELNQFEVQSMILRDANRDVPNSRVFKSFGDLELDTITPVSLPSLI